MGSGEQQEYNEDQTKTRGEGKFDDLMERYLINQNEKKDEHCIESFPDDKEYINNKVQSKEKEESHKKEKEMENKKFCGKKRGKENKKHSKKNSHSKYSQDNVNTKIQIHYLSFIINFINEVVKEIMGNTKRLELKVLDHNFKKNVWKKFVNELKKH